MENAELCSIQIEEENRMKVISKCELSVENGQNGWQIICPFA